MKKIVLLASSLFILSSVGSIYAEETTTSEMKQESVADKDPFDMASYKIVFETDMYKIGSDMPAGEYKVYSLDEYASFKLTGDARGEEYIAYDMVKTFAYVKVEDGQYLELSDCFAVPVEETWPVKIENDTIGEGVYRVGIDIEPGEYKAKAKDEFARYRISKDANAIDVVDSNSIKKSSYVDVKEGEYLKLEGAELSLK
ncbi:hypothetical protein JXA27_10315 [Aerococcaceae bacterium zg-B36]|uniref:hypothetical protein n=1 Tax=Aerococcaceae bacterium zg-252 TaxID=2796928 RepID=UPI001BD8E37E|nr:hypothetical protein [Aerococcaceae bacterium zg-B36]